MATVVEVKRNQYSGLDAEKAAVTGVAGDTFTATDTGKQYAWDVNTASWSGPTNQGYVTRAATTTDKTEVDFTLDGTWKVNGLDLTSIIPVGAYAVHLLLEGEDNLTTSVFAIRQNATNIYNTLGLRSRVSNIFFPSNHGFIKLDSDRLLDYTGTAGYDSIDLAVLGWFI